MVGPDSTSSMMTDLRTIGQIARRARVPVSTVRYYERRGLLRPDARSEGNYRLYGDEAMHRLVFIRSAQAAGFTLGDITALLEYQDSDGAPCREVQQLITDRQAQVTQEICRLNEIDQMLCGWMGRCRDAEKSGRCGVLEGLDAIGQEKCEKDQDCP